ncbi:hypothetical protein VIGAN_08003100 [Vigna angularis var. angularis]|uniref:Uncharacterized protein n=1 Tax=Vigna angularis var. angularis TaxID=157739 RepID=A0A0S3SL26_PHAAN|nr:hypothetical protein VIGAN_08003100 [Vigna angularis var. angularis]
MMRLTCDVVNTSMKCTLLLLQLIRGTKNSRGKQKQKQKKKLENSNQGKMVISPLILFVYSTFNFSYLALHLQKTTVLKKLIGASSLSRWFCFALVDL